MKRSVLILLTIWFGALVFVLNAQAAEPVFCSTEYFKAHERVTNAPRTKRLHSYQIGKLELNGLAVGGSDAVEVAAFAKAPASKKHCTWYLNQGNKLAEQIFHHEYMRGPYWGWLPWEHKKVVKSYSERMEKHWEPMVQCAVEQNYLAMGCDGHKHRGPSVFAAFLSLAGCNPKTATKIANDIWALNGVPNRTRKAIAELGWNLGNQKPELRAQLQKVMTEVPVRSPAGVK